MRNKEEVQSARLLMQQDVSGLLVRTNVLLNPGEKVLWITD
jgi:hypothetical protein